MKPITIYKNGDLHIYLESNYSEYLYDLIGFSNIGRIQVHEISSDEFDTFYKEYNELIEFLNSDASEKDKVEKYICFCGYYDGHLETRLARPDEIPEEENNYYFKLNNIWCYDSL